MSQLPSIMDHHRSTFRVLLNDSQTIQRGKIHEIDKDRISLIFRSRHTAFHNAMEENSERMSTSPVRSYHAARCRPDTDLQIPNLERGTMSTRSDGTLVDRAYENIEILLGEDPKSYLPKDGELRDLRNEISLKIDSAVKTWLTASNTGQPQFFEAVRDPSSFHLLKRIYGIGKREELICKIARMSKQHSIDVEVLLRALIGFAVFEWVFEAHHRSLDAAGDERATCETAKEVRNGFPRTSQIHPGDSHSMLLQLLSESGFQRVSLHGLAKW